VDHGAEAKLAQLLRDGDLKMRPRMSEAEINLFKSIVSNSNRYFEFGSGGSTYTACSLVKESVLSVDSSIDWHHQVREKCLEERVAIKPTLVHIDIGALGDWGYPKDDAAREKWPSYYTDIWNDAVSSDADLYMVDGRFRVACFMQILLHCESDSLIMFHDYTSRKPYHVVAEVAREVASAEDLTVFLPRRTRSRRRVAEILALHAFTTQ